ncbi:hypothetical protein [Mycobacteroides abscessus]|uniref:hypothetical protein n=1 Tax=Mycobacteroides abscessus TaxID=36809 RepID=UPI00092886C7|nr:hypothetical protein [Mycobacteroides abscessus]SIE09855.1 Uncharacterised protein [Mycobacteroides abscessus subsp. abscessus]
MPTAEEWRSLAATGIVELLETEGAATQPGMEAKLADASWRYSGSLAIFPIAYTTPHVSFGHIFGHVVKEPYGSTWIVGMH